MRPVVILRFFFYWLAMTIGIILVGAILGSVAFLLVGKLAGLDYTASELLYNGCMDGGFYALIWAPGTSIVICFILAHRERGKSAERP